MHLEIRYLATLSLVAITALSGCATDRRKDIAFQILFVGSGQPDTAAFAAALAARFPPESSPSALQSFVGSMGGTCRKREQGHLWCEIPTRTTFCAASMLGIDITLQSGLVGPIKVIGGGIGC